MLATAREAGGLSTEGPGAPDFRRAMRAAIHKASCDMAFGQREIVATLLVVDAKITARRLPLRAVRGDAAAARPVMRQQMSEFVAQCPINLFRAEGRQA